MLTALLFVVFRAPTIADAFAYLKIIFSKSIGIFESLQHQNSLYLLGVFIIAFFTAEWVGRDYKFTLEKLELRIPKIPRYALYFTIAMVIFLFAEKEHSFIYFQF
jgi:hypothetical protein